MKNRLSSILGIIFLFLVLRVAGAGLVLPRQVFAQEIPTSLEFSCGEVNTSTKSAQCELKVPADTIGTELNISVSDDRLTGLNELKAGKGLPASGAFFKMQSARQSSKYILEIDFAQLNGKTFSISPYGLVTFTLVLKSVEASLFPMTIPAKLIANSAVYTHESLLKGKSSYTAPSDKDLFIMLTLGGDTTTTTTTIETLPEDLPTGHSSPIRSTFNYEENKYCFDDPKDSMTEREWVIICEAKRRGIVSGNVRENGIFFFPNQTINRAEAVKIVTLGVLRSLGRLSDTDFSQEEKKIKRNFEKKKFIKYVDVKYKKNGDPPWFAVYTNIGTKNKIVHGYRENNTYRPSNKINNAESYRVIVEAGRVASDEISKTLRAFTIPNEKVENWFMKYVKTLRKFKISHSDEYTKFTTRKDFLIIVMDLLVAVGL